MALLDSRIGSSIVQSVSLFDPVSGSMAKSSTQLIKMVSTADTGYFYVAKKNTRIKTEKLELLKYDPRARKHVLFKESKMK